MKLTFFSVAGERAHVSLLLGMSLACPVPASLSGCSLLRGPSQLPSPSYMPLVSSSSTQAVRGGEGPSETKMHGGEGHARTGAETGERGHKPENKDC